MSKPEPNFSCRLVVFACIIRFLCPNRIYILHEPQSITMHYIRDERGDEALMLCRPMGLGFPAVRTRQEGKEKRYEKQ